MKRWLKRLLLALGVLVIAALIAGGVYGWMMLRIGNAYSAKILCSSVFVSGRPADSVRAEDLGALSFIGSRVDQENRTASASFLGLVKRKAVYRECLGCTLVNHTTVEALREQGRAAPAPPDAGLAERLWPDGDRMPSDPLPDGIDQAQLDKALDEAFSEPNPELPRRTRAVVILYQGRLVAERYGPGITPDTRLLGWSMTKSVINALVGILVGQGKLRLNDQALTPEWQAEDDPRRAISLTQLLHMQSGLKFDEAYDRPSDATNMLFAAYDAAAYAASKPLAFSPDTRWEYSSGTTNVISRIVRRAVGGSLTDYFAFPRRALFDRIGMRSAVIEPDPSGTFVGSSYMYATARDWARFGLLYLNDGQWGNERILPVGWVAYTRQTAKRAPLGQYGAQFWLNAGEPNNPARRPMPRLPADLFFCEGFEGQSVNIIPSRDLVVVRLGQTPRSGGWDQEDFLAKVLAAFPLPESSGVEKETGSE